MGPEARKKTLKVFRMDAERIRNVMSEVMGLWSRVEPLRGCEASDLPLQCPKESTALCQAGSCARESELTQNNTELVQKHHSVQAMAQPFIH